MIDQDAAWRKALEPFSDEARGSVHQSEILCLMDPVAFLRLASPISARIDSRKRTQGIRRTLDRNVGLRTLPCLELQIDGVEASVTGHDGRHRAMELADRGHSLIPVLLCFEDCEAEDFGHVNALHPQPHDDDEEYPGYDEDDLDDRERPMRIAGMTGFILMPAGCGQSVHGSLVPEGEGR